jgi:hypothetical protein
VLRHGEKLAWPLVSTLRRSSRTRAQRRLPAQVRYGLVGVLTVLALLSDVWRLGHLLLVRHVACPYDGVLVHADELPTVAAQGPRAGRDPRLREATAAPRHEHEDCCARSAVHRPLAFAFACQNVVGALEPSLSLPSPSAEGGAVRAVLSYAPKLSPPI